MPIATIETEFVAAPDVPGADPAAPSTWWPAIIVDALTRARPYLQAPVIPQARAVGGDLPAYVNHGRWVVNCPSCPSAQNASFDDPWFWCPTCGSGGMWHKVTFPKQRTAIEVLLEKRPDITTRNWLPGESVADLRRENTDHGIRD